MESSDMRPEYDFSKGIRGKYAALYKESANVVKIDDDIADVFPNEASVNDALHALAPLLRAKKAQDTVSKIEAREKQE